MEHLAIQSHNSFKAIGFHKSRSPSSPYGPAPQGSQLITLHLDTWTPGHQVIWPLGHLATWPLIHLSPWPVCYLATWPLTCEQ